MFKSIERRTVAAWPALVRIVQVNVGLTDARSLDGDALVSKLMALGTSGVVSNTGGIYAWYSTELPYQARNPYLVNRDLVADANVRTIPQLLNHELDIVLGVIDPAISDNLVLAVPVIEVEHGIVLPADDPRCRQTSIEPSEPTDKMWVLHTEDPETERSISEHYLHRGKSAPNIDVRTSSFSTGLQHVRHQEFVMSAPIQLSSVIEKEGLVMWRIRDDMPKRQAGLHIRQSGANIAVIQYAVEFLPSLVEGQAQTI